VLLDFFVFCVCFVDRCLSFFLLATVLSVLLRFTESDYPIGILDLRNLITPLVSSNSYPYAGAIGLLLSSCGKVIMTNFKSCLLSESLVES